MIFSSDLLLLFQLQWTHCLENWPSRYYIEWDLLIAFKQVRRLLSWYNLCKNDQVFNDYNSRPELNHYISSSAKLVLSRSTSDALLSSRISLPRVWNSERERSVLGDINYQCGNCGYRNFSCLDISPTKARVSHRRPQSMFADHNNYVKFSFRVSLSIEYFLLCRTIRPPDLLVLFSLLSRIQWVECVR